MKKATTILLLDERNKIKFYEIKIASTERFERTLKFQHHLGALITGDLWRTPLGRGGPKLGHSVVNMSILCKY